MSWSLVTLPLVALSAAVLVLAPRPLFAEAAAAPPARRLEAVLGLALAGLGIGVFLAAPGDAPLVRMLTAAAIMAMAAIVYADLRFLIIPDVYSLTLAAIGLIGPLSPGVLPAFAGAAICGGLLALVAWAFRKRTDVEGMGFGDVKLAAAAGALLGPEQGLWAIAASAVVASLTGLVWKRMRKSEAPLMIPYGAALALAAGAILIGMRL
ncbi:MAG TPA: prepilin peptidase [Caulobacteraceae bacterium]|nr:prepilin peptidase [Caulobacteraceae bacterium]